jgi:peptidoglycan/xylan/chitin deacetylase (PgdA/CDA1 family)
LTYDDGPYSYTDALLDVLKAKNVKATFFISGNNIGKGAIDSTAQWRTVIKRAYNEGHQIASHTWDHLDLSTLTTDQQRFQMNRNEQALLSIIGRYPTYMRPPFISCDSICKQTMSDLGYHVIIWDLNTQDYKNDTPQDIQKSKDIVRNYLDGNNPATTSFDSIAHDVHYQTVYNLTSYQIDLQTASGYRHVRLGECLNDPQANWYRTTF